MNIVFMGSPDFAIASLNAILNSKHVIKMVVSQPDKPANRGQKVTPCSVAEFANEYKLDLEQPLTLKNNPVFLDKLKKIEPDVIVVVAYGKIVPKEILNLPKYGCVNLHASLLPKYRGAAPINWAIINGEGVSGVTTMFMNEKMDEGDILLQCQTDIMPCDTATDLHDHLAIMGADLLIKTLDMMEGGDLKGIPQDHKKATYSPKLKKEDGLIDWKRSAQGVYNKIRGLQPWPRAFTYISPSPYSSPSRQTTGGQARGEGKGGGEILFIYDAAVIETDDKKNEPGTIISLENGIIVATGFGRLCILEVQQSGKNRMPAIEFIKGNKLKVGERFL